MFRANFRSIIPQKYFKHLLEGFNISGGHVFMHLFETRARANTSPMILVFCGVEFRKIDPYHWIYWRMVSTCQGYGEIWLGAVLLGLFSFIPSDQRGLVWEGQLFFILCCGSFFLRFAYFWNTLVGYHLLKMQYKPFVLCILSHKIIHILQCTYLIIC